MRYIFWENHKVLIRNFIFFLMGIYVGMIIYLNFHGNKIDRLIEENGQLSLELNSCQKKVEIYDTEQKQRTNRLIKAVKFNFLKKPEQFHETDLLKTLVEETHFIIGKKIDDVAKSPEFIYQLLDGKTFSAKDKKYDIKVQIIYISSSIDIWILVSDHRDT